MANPHLAGVEVNIALLNAILPAARDQLQAEMGTLAKAVLEIQRAMAPRKTGALATSLDIADEVDRMRFRIGLQNITRRGKRAAPGDGGVSFDTWYGIIMEYGRTAGQGIVTRRKPGQPKGRSRHANPGGYESYTMHWAGLTARPFVHVESRIDAVLDAIRTRFWDEVLANAGNAA